MLEIKLDLPLLRGTKIKLENECVWVDFKYEQVPTFCFYCGLIGHQERLCHRKMEDAREDRVCEGQYGEWMRAIGSKEERRGWNGENNVRKKVELQLNQIHSERGNRRDRDEERGGKGE